MEAKLAAVLSPGAEDKLDSVVDESGNKVVGDAGVERLVFAVFVTEVPKEEMMPPFVRLVVVAEARTELVVLSTELISVKEDPDVLRVAVDRDDMLRPEFLDEDEASPPETRSPDVVDSPEVLSSPPDDPSETLMPFEVNPVEV